MVDEVWTRVAEAYNADMVVALASWAGGRDTAGEGVVDGTDRDWVEGEVWPDFAARFERTLQSAVDTAAATEAFRAEQAASQLKARAVTAATAATAGAGAAGGGSGDVGTAPKFSSAKRQLDSVCKFDSRPGGCQRLDTCEFMHSSRKRSGMVIVRRG